MDTILEVKNLSISFGGIRAVQNLSFSVEKGEILGLIGPNGSGKSTCINLISGTCQQDSGSIWFGGKEISRHRSIGDRVRLGMGRTFQTPKPFGNMTVFENVYTTALQHYDHRSAEVEASRVLDITRLLDNKNLISSKLPIEKRKWLDLARVLINKPTFVMLDEVMAGLNPSEMQESIQLIQDVNATGVTFLFVEHVVKAVLQLCHRVMVINHGQLLAAGKPADVLQQQEVIRAYIGGEKRAEH